MHTYTHESQTAFSSRRKFCCTCTDVRSGALTIVNLAIQGRWSTSSISPRDPFNDSPVPAVIKDLFIGISQFTLTDKAVPPLAVLWPLSLLSALSCRLLIENYSNDPLFFPVFFLLFLFPVFFLLFSSAHTAKYVKAKPKLR